MKSKSNHTRILKTSLGTIVRELLPLAVEDYKDSRSQSKAYIVTNMLSEARSLISQIESSIDDDRIILEVSKVITKSLRTSVNRMMNSIVIAKKSLALKIKDASARRNFETILDKLTKDYEQNITDTISSIEDDMAETIKEVLKSNPKAKKRKKG